MKRIIYIYILFSLIPCVSGAQNLIPVGKGWANNSVNVTVFRKNSLISHKDTQFIAYYDPDGYMVLGKRKTGSKEWTLNRTQYRGNVEDAHNGISIMADGDGYLHVAWDHHGHPLRYARSKEPLGLELTEKQAMTGNRENNVTYPEFYRMPDGSLIFMYRDGQSGQGNLVINRYRPATKKWIQVQQNLIDGEGKRNAYWQACVDNRGIIHLSWVWRETPDVSSNHDLCYAWSSDGGFTWQKSNGEKYDLPVNACNAEIICRIPENSELINQTSMTTDAEGNPYIASYWRVGDSAVPQYHVVYYNGDGWHDSNLNLRKTAFSLSGHGTKRIPISRPQVVVKSQEGKSTVFLLYRDIERDEKVSVAVCDDIVKGNWIIKDLTDFSVGAWEPSYDTGIWQKEQKLHVFVQNAEQVDSEGKASIDPQTVYVMEVSTTDY